MRKTISIITVIYLLMVSVLPVGAQAPTDLYCVGPDTSQQEVYIGGWTYTCEDLGYAVLITFDWDSTNWGESPLLVTRFGVPTAFVSNGTPIYIEIDGVATIYNSTNAYNRSVWQYSTFITPEINQTFSQGNSSGTTSSDIVISDVYIPGSATPLLNTKFNTAWSSEMNWTGTILIYGPGYCEGAYDVPYPETFTIDPIIEDPLGPAGSPPDDQIFPTETGVTYQVTLGGAGWNDSVDERKDAAVSWDGITWTPFDELVSECVGVDADENVVSAVITAESETFYIRSNDTEGNFADNTQVDEEDPYTYTIGVVVEVVSCEDQFTFDPEDDLVGSVSVSGNDTDGVQATGTEGLSPIPEMVPTEWYAVTVTSGTWRDEGIAPDRTDMEFQVTHNLGFNVANYADLGDGGDGVWCQSTSGTTWYIQARSTDLYLRVNNITGAFTGNTGSLNVSIYHAAFERPLEACEIGYDEFEAPHRSEVQGNSENGKTFAYNLGDDDPFAGLTGGASASGDPFYVQAQTWSAVRLVPGAWYIIDTIEGPWIANKTDWNVYRYDMAVNDGSGWEPLEDWSVPECNVELDALGHRRIYFQVPSGEYEWAFRVNDSTFGDNAGYLAWNIYRAIEVDFANPAFNPWSGCLDNAQNSYDVLAFNEWIPVKFEEGTYVKGNINGGVGANGLTTTITEQILSVGGTYVIQIAGGPWDDDESDETLGDQYGAAVSSDNGVTWFPIDQDTPGAECLSVDQEGNRFQFKFTVSDGEIWKIRVNDESGDFANNGGNLAYHLYRIRNFYGAELGAGANPTSLCTGPIPRPIPPTDALDIAGWLNYVGGWVNYGAMSIRRFFSLCPQHINNVMAVIQRLKTLEPLASVTEAIGVIDDVKIEIGSYAWDSNPQSTSIFDIESGAELNQIVNEHFFPTSSTARSPWEGGDIIDTSDFNGGYSPGSYFYTCLNAFDGYLPTPVANGVCFVSAAFRDTGASFWIQLSFDVSCIFLMVRMTKRPLQEVIYMMTGVRPWTRSGAESGIDKLAQYLQERDHTLDNDARELGNRFGGSFIRDRDGTFRRR